MELKSNSPKIIIKPKPSLLTINTTKSQTYQEGFKNSSSLKIIPKLNLEKLKLPDVKNSPCHATRTERYITKENYYYSKSSRNFFNSYISTLPNNTPYTVRESIDDILKTCNKNKKSIKSKLWKKYDKDFKNEEDIDKESAKEIKNKTFNSLVLFCPNQNINFLTIDKNHFLIKYNQLTKLNPVATYNNKKLLYIKYGIRESNNEIKIEDKFRIYKLKY
jgi:hypothetical protein